MTQYSSDSGSGDEDEGTQIDLKESISGLILGYRKPAKVVVAAEVAKPV